VENPLKFFGRPLLIAILLLILLLFVIFASANRPGAEAVPSDKQIKIKITISLLLP
jgi:hypothetical protein